MGACIGKKSKKYLENNQQQSNHKKVPDINIQDDKTVENRSSSPTSSQMISFLPIIEDDNVQFRESAIEQMGINSEIQSIIDEQDLINETLRTPFSNRVISTTDTELNLELANLVFEQTKNSLDIPIENENTNNTN